MQQLRLVASVPQRAAAPVLAPATSRRRSVLRVAAVARSSTQQQRTQQLSIARSGAQVEQWQQDAAADGPQSALARAWYSVPATKKLALASHLAFVISNIDKVVFMVSVVPLGMEFGWTPATAGLVQSSFFAGFLLMQIPGGGLSSAFGGRRVLPFGVSLWSAATALIPMAAVSLPTLCLARSLVGAGQAIGPSSVMDIVARTEPKEQRSSAVAFVFAGLHVGSAVALLTAPLLINSIGWRAMFGVFGSVGLVWAVAYELLVADIAKTQPQLAAQLTNSWQEQQLQEAEEAATAEARLRAASGTLVLRPALRRRVAAQVGADAAAAKQADGGIPYRAFLRSRPVQALMITHFCNNWLHYTMLSWLPTYFVDTMSVDLMHASQTALLPPLAGIAASAVAGTAADKLISAGMPLASVRKLAQGFAFVMPAGCLLAACTSTDKNLTVAAITAALGLSSFSLAGLYCSHQDLSPKYASALLGLTNTSGSVPGIIGVATVGLIYQNTQSWEAALFAPCAALLLLGTALYTAYSQHEPVDFDAADNSPFGFELRARAAWNNLQTSVTSSPVGRLLASLRDAAQQLQHRR